MNQITVDELSLGQFRSVEKLAEVRDAAGNVVGYFAPVGDPETALQFRRLALYDPAEIARRKANPGKGLTTKQVFEHLMTLTTDPADLADLREGIKELEERA
jgi:hypothetical protein